MSIYRYQFTDALLDYMREFANIHRLDDRETFKEAYQKWRDEEHIRTVISREARRLQEDGSKHDIERKLYTSLRYYFSKRRYVKEEKKERNKIYEKSNKDELKIMDDFILRDLSIKPSILYQQYAQEYDMEDTVRNKKTFKNRVFIQKQKEKKIKQ
jgi:hypothetical protein